MFLRRIVFEIFDLTIQWPWYPG